MRLLFSLALLAASGFAAAQNAPRVLLETDRGPMLLQLDVQRAPNTVANFLAYVDDGSYNATLIQRVVPNFIVQGGAFKDTGAAITRRPAINSERNNGLLNTHGKIAMALSGNPPNINSATSDWFINTATNTTLDQHFTVFGEVVFGLRTLAAINNTPRFSGSGAEQPIRMPLLKRAVRVAEGKFPILPLHTGSWYDPTKSGRGILLEITQASGSETGPLLVLSWYDYFEGEQAWFTGAVPFQWGAHELVVPMQVTRGGEFGDAFDPAQVIANPAWGTLTVRFTGCATAEFSYESDYGNGNLTLQHLTEPVETLCKDS